ncbi:unnamed protein product [Camellia sinensis]|uniref:uncharacterized protein LOC114273506 isoform X1 n=1 Tax=Camellia sinensis TaxID=4442 RepID=UPI001036A8B4|nr:uncharacterized protein LOC114273506 isoform X1 [Camellia sinensis]
MGGESEAEVGKKMEELAELERLQARLLHRITEFELSHLPQHFSDSLSVSSPPENLNAAAIDAAAATEARLSAILRSNGVRDFSFKRVPFDYYDFSAEARRDILGGYSIDHLCKSIVLVNTQAPSNVTDCSDRNNSKYYIVVVQHFLYLQYTARFSADTVKNFLYSLNNGKIPKKKFNLRLAPEETSLKLTGFGHNAVTCIGMNTDIPVILDEAITKLNPDFFWLGGGEVFLKLGIRTSEFINFVRPFIVSCSSTT